MWARICEILLAIWLLFSHQDWVGVACAILILIFASLCYIERLNKMHLLQVMPAAILFYVSYTAPMPLPIAMQNYILVALSLLVFAIVPSKASDPPRPWRKFR